MKKKKVPIDPLEKMSKDELLAMYMGFRKIICFERDRAEKAERELKELRCDIREMKTSLRDS